MYDLRVENARYKRDIERLTYRLAHIEDTQGDEGTEVSFSFSQGISLP